MWGQILLGMLGAACFLGLIFGIFVLVLVINLIKIEDAETEVYEAINEGAGSWGHSGRV